MTNRTEAVKTSQSRQNREIADLAGTFERDFNVQVGKLERWMDLSPYEKYLGQFRKILSAAWSRTFIADGEEEKKFTRATLARIPVIFVLTLAGALTPIAYDYLPAFGAYWLLALLGTGLSLAGIAPRLIFHALVVVDILAVTFVVHLCGSLTSVEVVFYPIIVILLTLAFGFFTGLIYAGVVTGAYTLLVVLEGTGALPYSPLLGHDFPYFTFHGIPTYPLAIIVAAHIITYGSAILTGVLTYEIEVKRRQAKAAVQTKNEMLAICSHDLKNLLVSITGFSELMLVTLERPDVSIPDIRAHARQIHASGNRMLELIFNLLDSARLEDGTIPIVRTRIELQEVIRNVHMLQAPNAELKSTEITCRLPDDPVWVNADRSKLAQVFTNLIQNAIIYTREQGSISIEMEPPVDGKVRVVVRDSGPGIAHEVMPILFDPIALGQRRQAAGRRLGNALSTGLGLSIVRKFIELHDGSLWVESLEGIGSSFWIELPIATPPIP